MDNPLTRPICCGGVHLIFLFLAPKPVILIVGARHGYEYCVLAALAVHVVVSLYLCASNVDPHLF